MHSNDYFIINRLGKAIITICYVFLIAIFLLALTTCGMSVNIACVLAVLAMYGFTGGAMLLFRMHKGMRFPAILFIGSFACYCIVALVINNPQVSDFATQIDSARAFNAGDTTAYHSWFYDIWPNQIGYSLLEAFLLKIIDKVMLIEFFQAACMSVTLVLIYFCTRMVFSEKVSRFLCIAVAVFPSFAFGVCATNNQILSATLVLFAVLLFMRIYHGARKVRHVVAMSILCGLSLGIAHFIRSDAIVVVVAFAIAIFSSLKRNEEQGGLLLKAISASCLLLAFVLMGFFSSMFLNVYDIVGPYSSTDRVAINKIVMGTNLETSGGWSSTYIDEIEALAQNKSISYQEAGGERLHLAESILSRR